MNQNKENTNNIIPFPDFLGKENMTAEEIVKEIKPEKILNINLLTSYITDDDPIIRFYLGDKNKEDGFCDIYEIALSEEGMNEIIKDLLKYIVEGKTKENEGEK